MLKAMLRGKLDMCMMSMVLFTIDAKAFTLAVVWCVEGGVQQAVPV